MKDSHKENYHEYPKTLWHDLIRQLLKPNYGRKPEGKSKMTLANKHAINSSFPKNAVV